MTFKHYLKITKLKIKNYRKIIIGSILIIIAIVLIWQRVQYNKSNPYGVWETMVILRSQESGAAPEEDMKTSLKRGDVIAVQPEHHAWSETEYKSYLLVKIEGRKQDVMKLLEPLVETQNFASLPAQDQQNQQTIRARKYAVDMDKVGFTGDQVISGQPVEDKIFKTDVIKEKS